LNDQQIGTDDPERLPVGLAGQRLQLPFNRFDGLHDVVALIVI
jgi:hypothetical protein